VPDDGEQHAVPGHVPGSVDEPAPPGRARPGASMPKRLLSGFLADGQDRAVPCRPPGLLAMILGMVCVPGLGWVTSMPCLPLRACADGAPGADELVEDEPAPAKLRPGADQ